MKTKKFYEKPELEAIEFTTQDICTASKPEPVPVTPEEVATLLLPQNTSGGNINQVKNGAVGTCLALTVNRQNVTSDGWQDILPSLGYPSDYDIPFGVTVCKRQGAADDKNFPNQIYYTIAKN